VKNAGDDDVVGILCCFQFCILHFEFLILSTSPLCPARVAPQGAICAGPLFCSAECRGNWEMSVLIATAGRFIEAWRGFQAADLFRVDFFAQMFNGRR
jgi:hypothetical protein